MQEKVLVVDDNEANRRLLEAHLVTAGYGVTVAESGARALELFASGGFDMVLLDIMMPGMDGFTTCRALRALPGGLDVPIVFLTALSGFGTQHSATGSGGDDLLTKPINRAELLLRVASLLRIRRMSRHMHANLEVIAAQRDALVEAQQHREELMSFIVHDLKNPLSSILANSQSLRGEGWSLEEAREVLGDVETAARSMLRMVLNLLDVSRGESGQLVLKTEEVDVGHLVNGVVALMRPRFIERNLRTVVEVEDASAEVDADIVRRLVENLVDNCVKHSPARGVVAIRAAVTADHLDLRISDEGPGIPAEQREKIFEKYVQLDEGEVSDDSRTGRGLGLAFCRLAAEAHGGRIWVEPNEPRGTTFAVSLVSRRAVG